MTRNAFTRFTAVALLVVGLTACTTTAKLPPSDVLAGTWYQNEKGDQAGLIWDFHADGTVAVHTWSSTSVQHGIYRHLQDDRVAIDFGSDEVSVVQINVNGKAMTMVNPGGARTVLERN